MKNLTRIIITGMVLLLSIEMNAQDTIVMNNGEQIYCKVIEFSLKDVNYKKTDSLTGPTYSKPKTEVLEVRFENGVKETMAVLMAPKNVEDLFLKGEEKLVIRGGSFKYKGIRLSSDELREIALTRNDPQLNLLVKKSKRNKVTYISSFVGVPIVFAGAGMMVHSLFANEKDTFENAVAVVAVGSVIVDVNIFCSARGKKLKKKIAQRYNETF